MTNPGTLRDPNLEAFDKTMRELPAGVIETSPALVVTVGARACAIPLRHVAETMRPLPIESVAGMPAFIRGVSVIRGAPVLVLDLRALLEPGEPEPSLAFARLVVVKLGERRLAVGVDAVVGLANLGAAQLEELPPILGDVSAALVESIGTRDAQLLVVLRATRLVPEPVWATLARAEATG